MSSQGLNLNLFCWFNTLKTRTGIVIGWQVGKIIYQIRSKEPQLHHRQQVFDSFLTRLCMCFCKHFGNVKQLLMIMTKTKLYFFFSPYYEMYTVFSKIFKPVMNSEQQFISQCSSNIQKRNYGETLAHTCNLIWQ